MYLLTMLIILSINNTHVAWIELPCWHKSRVFFGVLDTYVIHFLNHERRPNKMCRTKRSCNCLFIFQKPSKFRARIRN